MKKSVVLLSALGVLAFAGSSGAVTVVYNIVNPALNALTLSGDLGAPHLPQGSPASLADTYTGSITADLTGGVLTFSGGSSLVAVLSTAAPFAPPGAGIDNYGVTLNPLIPGGGVIAFRDMDFDIVGGTATHGSPTTASFNFNAGHADYNAPAFGAPGTLPFVPVPPAANSSPTPVTIVTVGLTETLTIPIRLVFPGNATTPTTNFNGQLVLERTIPEPAGAALALAALTGAFRRRR